MKARASSALAGTCLELRADERCARKHVRQSSGTPPRHVGESLAVILNQHLCPPLPAAQLYPDASRGRMAHDVVDGLLGDTVERHHRARRKPVEDAGVSIVEFVADRHGPGADAALEQR